MFGFPTNKDEIFILNYCIHHTKHYIYIERLFDQNNICHLMNLEVYTNIEIVV